MTIYPKKQTVNVITTGKIDCVAVAKTKKNATKIKAMGAMLSGKTETRRNTFGNAVLRVKCINTVSPIPTTSGRIADKITISTFVPNPDKIMGIHSILFEYTTKTPLPFIVFSIIDLL